VASDSDCRDLREEDGPARGFLPEPEKGAVVERADVVVPAGGEVLSTLTLAVHAQVPLATLRQMIYAYPTFHRAVEDALRDLGHA
jgi:hypothetical protein